MGLSHWMSELKFKIAATQKQKKFYKKFSKQLRKMSEEAKKYGGDPWYEYRKNKILPEKVEYGMNCFMNCIFQSEGEEVAQKTYEVLKELGGVSLNEDTSSGNFALFGVQLNLGIEAENRAMRIIKNERARITFEEFRDKVFGRQTNFLQKAKDETEYEYTLKLAALSMGLANRSSELYKEGKLSQSDRLRLYSEVIQEIVQKINPQHRLSDEEIDTLLSMSKIIGNMIPNKEKKFSNFFSRLRTDFWNTLWVNILEHSYPSEVPVKDIRTTIDYYVQKFERDNRTQIEKWKEKIHHLNTSEEQNIIWEEIKNKVADERFTKGFTFLLTAAIFFELFGYKGGIVKAIANAEKGLLKWLFNKLVTECVNRK